MGFTNVYGVPRWGEQLVQGEVLSAAARRLGDWVGAWVLVERQRRDERQTSLERIEHVTVKRIGNGPPTCTVGCVGKRLELELDASWSATAVTSDTITLTRCDGRVVVSRVAAEPSRSHPSTALRT
jgi:hypothetical protein